ncbi:MAG TPA: MBL fold metallo-hydrolase [Syntrophales bacterium]|nr:MBL fold metallo-hydrolase [Syntrophales bacterium]HON22263.1 MBL fold metallo-hydrolase [Syntrophales bacterium]HOU78111.1 MBL fold metallo-hydrolase [Syntrophales bacterium]HPC33425.1 MBL fold metallo-hydrolase [Syntrophales bacterium]HQG34730.1 MBL fold metallo-hydrolase [Syntrophales bacterium]
MDISTIPLGFDNAYLIREKQAAILVDAGVPGKAGVLKKALGKIGIPPEAVRLIVITHGHWDHIGSAQAIKELTGAPLAMHRAERPWLEAGNPPLPPGVTTWGRIFRVLLFAFSPLIRIAPATVDITLDEGVFPLAPYGIPGRVIPTPGHSPGSVSVLLDTGEACVGDLAMNKFPLCLKPGPPIFATDPDVVRNSWELLLQGGARTIYPAHGKPFAAAILKKDLSP